MFRILRYFSLASLATIVVAAVLLVVLYRETAIKSIVHLGEQTNVTVAKTALNSIQAQAVDYLASIAKGKTAESDRRLARFAREVGEVTRGTAVVRIKLYDPQGKVVFSTDPERVAEDQDENAGFQAAIRGQVASKLVYRDQFNAFDRVTEDDNLIQTYLPVRQASGSSVLGVFEIYTDVSILVEAVERTEIFMVVGAAGIMGLLYVALLFIVRRADQVITRQRETIYERSRALELVSAQLFIAQENDRKRVAGGLHEGLAQSLVAVKHKLDNSLHAFAQTHAGADLRPLNGVLTALEGAIDEVRTLAMQLRPSSLDDLGLIDTLAWYLKHLQQTYPSVPVSFSLGVEEQDVPAHLKVGIYRIIEETLDFMLRQQQAHTISVGLKLSSGRLLLVIGDTGQPYRPTGQGMLPDESGLAAAKERALLSGGTFAVEMTPWGATQINASWPLLSDRLSHVRSA
jgi:signal transduction histidine kinase